MSTPERPARGASNDSASHSPTHKMPAQSADDQHHTEQPSGYSSTASDTAPTDTASFRDRANTSAVGGPGTDNSSPSETHSAGSHAVNAASEVGTATGQSGSTQQHAQDTSSGPMPPHGHSSSGHTAPSQQPGSATADSSANYWASSAAPAPQYTSAQSVKPSTVSNAGRFLGLVAGVLGGISYLLGFAPGETYDQSFYATENIRVFLTVPVLPAALLLAGLLSLLAAVRRNETLAAVAAASSITALLIAFTGYFVDTSLIADLTFGWGLVALTLMSVLMVACTAAQWFIEMKYSSRSTSSENSTTTQADTSSQWGATHAAHAEYPAGQPAHSGPQYGPAGHTATPTPSSYGQQQPGYGQQLTYNPPGASQAPQGHPQAGPGYPQYGSGQPGYGQQGYGGYGQRY